MRSVAVEPSDYGKQSVKLSVPLARRESRFKKKPSTRCLANNEPPARGDERVSLCCCLLQALCKFRRVSVSLVDI